MNAGDALLADILAEPDAEDLRLIYADWLEENGDKGQREHATLIRWQVETGVVLRQERGSKRWQRLGGKKFGKAPSEFWRAAGSLVPWWMPGPVVIERGFLAEVGCECDDWMHSGPRLVRRHPIRSVQVVDKIPWGFLENRGTPIERPLYGWVFGEINGLNRDLPPQVWGLLATAVRTRPCATGGGNGILWHLYETDADANRTASEAFLAWACATPAHPGNYVVAVETAPIPDSGP